MQTKPEAPQTLDRMFLKSVEEFGHCLAVEAAGEALSYERLFEKAAALSATLVKHEVQSPVPLTAIFAYRSMSAFAGVLAALLRGHGYVPLNRTFPTDRTRTMLQRSDCRAMIVDGESAKQLPDLLEGLDHPLLIVMPDTDEVEAYAARWQNHRFVGAREIAPASEWRAVPVSADSLAYLLFTSGSTGAPKGVMVTHRNVGAYVDFIAERHAITAADRFSQTFDMTFDLSAGDMFVGWKRGACVCCPSEKTLLNPGRFIKESNLSVWFSVPSTALFMKRLGALKAGSYPGLRVSLFCGEALPVETANAWASAAPNSVVENLYGPTELTIACTCYRWESARSPAESADGVAPIGFPFPGMAPLVVDESLNEVRPGEIGELLMTGPQLSLGYWRDADKTAASFVRPPGREQTYYRTGDRVRRPLDKGPLLYVGRADNQVKILGHRVELGEVEAVVRVESGIEGVAAVGWPPTTSGAGGIEVFLQAEEADLEALRQSVSRRLPSYMVPRRWHLLPQFPLNANGKCDRKALIKRLEAKT
jgi:amino acid adenylation domain-containing protein